MKICIRVNNLLSTFVSLLSTIIAYGIANNCSTLLEKSQVILVYIVLNFILFYFSNSNRFNEVIGPFLFSASFIIFHFGQYMLYALRIPFTDFYFARYGTEVMIKTAMLFLSCFGAVFAALNLCPLYKPIPFSVSSSKEHVFNISRIGLYISGCVAAILMIIKLVIFSIGYYQGVLAFEARVPSVIGLLEYYFIPFSILYLVYCEEEKKTKTIFYIMLIWSLLTSLLGDRTSGIGGIIVLILLYGKGFISKDSFSKKSIRIIAALVFTVILVGVAFEVRENRSFNLSTVLTSSATHFFEELGGSFLPTTLILMICPSSYPFVGFSSYLASLSGLFPTSLDFVGIFNGIIDTAFAPRHWIDQVYSYDYGVGYSLVAEAYASFGLYAYLAVFVICMLVFKFLISPSGGKDSSDSRDLFKFYVFFVLLFKWFTLPRRNVYYFFSHLLYCVILVSIVTRIKIREKR